MSHPATAAAVCALALEFVDLALVDFSVVAVRASTVGMAAVSCACAALGLDLRPLHQLMSLGSVNNLMFQFMLGTMLEGGPGRLDGLKFSLANASKDLRAYTALAADLGVPASVGAAVHQALVQANALGLGDKYIASLITAQEQLAGVTIVPKDSQ